MKKNDTQTAKSFEPMDPLPEWFDGKRVYESAFCKAFLEAEPMVCYNGSGSMGSKFFAVRVSFFFIFSSSFMLSGMYALRLG